MGLLQRLMAFLGGLDLKERKWGQAKNKRV